MNLFSVSSVAESIDYWGEIAMAFGLAMTEKTSNIQQGMSNVEVMWRRPRSKIAAGAYLLRG